LPGDPDAAGGEKPAGISLPKIPALTRRPKPPRDKTGGLPDSGDPNSGDMPSTAILTAAPPRDEVRHRRQLDGMGKVLVEKLATFRIEGEIVGTTTGPAVTQFEVSPAPGVKVSKIANLEADLALAMRAASVRIVAPIPGKAAVGVEIPNLEPETVFFREVIESSAFRTSAAALPLALGKDISGKPYIADLARMPHLLIAGATGSGKSVCINTIITSLIYRHSPRTLRLLMVDPKMVELSVYNDLPHLRHPVVTDNNDAAGVLKWALLEMERRYALLSSNNVRNILDFNKRVADGQLIRSPEPLLEEGHPERFIYKDGALPYIVLIIDELADLMMTVQGDVEKPLAMLAQKARAIGIHLILATQRPSVNVITGLIKANFPSRIAFRVSSKVDSRTILDQNGADTLLGNGDMLFLPPGRSDPLRIQGAFLSTEDTEQLMDWFRERAQEKAEATVPDGVVTGEKDILEIVRASENSLDEMDTADDPSDRDKLFREAAALCVQHQGGSTSLLQRRLRIGYGRAARIIDQLENAGVLGPPDGSKPREVLVDFVQLDQLYPED
jgi:S-DNA-T family DNA segregation ATPase FtsK/SpoIIIE